MHLLFSPIFSGSSGNAVYVGNEDGAVLVDAGMSATAILNEMNTHGIDPSTIKAILVTHSHDDHVKGVGVLSRKLKVPIYATADTWAGMEKKLGKLDPLTRRVTETGVDFYIGNINIYPFETPHDAHGSCGYVFSTGGIKASVATDIGCVRDGWLNCVLGSDIVLLESNYDPDMLIAGPYPAELKQRIKGRHGHLSNEDAGKVAVKLVQSGTRNIILGHLSEHNNYPELAFLTSKAILRENGYECGKDVELCVASRNGCSGVYSVTRGE